MLPSCSDYGGPEDGEAQAIKDRRIQRGLSLTRPANFSLNGRQYPTVYRHCAERELLCNTHSASAQKTILVERFFNHNSYCVTSPPPSFCPTIVHLV